MENIIGALFYIVVEGLSIVAGGIGLAVCLMFIAYVFSTALAPKR